MRPGCRLWLAIGSLALLGSCAFLGKIAFTYYDFRAAANELPEALQAYKAEGLPFVAADIAPPRLPDAQNAAPGLRAAIAAIPKGKAITDVGDALKRTPGPADDTALALFAPALAKVKDAAVHPKIDFHRDWDLGPYILFPEYADMKTLARAAALSAIRAAQKGDDAAAIRSLGLARQIAVWSSQEPTLISVLVRIAVESIALNAAERCLAQAAGRPERIARYARWLANAPKMPDFGYAMRGEAWTGVVVCRNFDLFGGIDSMIMSSKMPEIDPARLKRDGLPDGNRPKGFLTRHLQLWTVASQTSNGFTKPAGEIGRMMERLVERTEREKGLSYYLERILLPVFVQAGDAVTGLAARRAVQKAYAETLTTWALTGRIPGKVATLDPFTQKPLRIRLDGKGFRVWSVGSDLKDDGGFSRSEISKRGKKGEDLVAVYPPLNKP